MSTPQEAMLDCPDYAIIATVQSSLGEPGIMLGTKGRCRFCGQTDQRAFRNVAHTLRSACLCARNRSFAWLRSCSIDGRSGRARNALVVVVVMNPLSLEARDLHARAEKEGRLVVCRSQVGLSPFGRPRGTLRGAESKTTSIAKARQRRHIMPSSAAVS